MQRLLSQEHSEEENLARIFFVKKFDLIDASFSCDQFQPKERDSGSEN